MTAMVALGGAVGLKKLRRHDRPVAVLHQQVAGVTQLGFLAAAFARQQRIRIAGRTPKSGAMLYLRNYLSYGEQGC